MIDQMNPEDIDVTRYWPISVQGICWEYILRQLLKPLEKAPINERPIIMIVVNGRPVYLLLKKYLPVEELSRRTGLSPEVLNTLPVIRLVELDRPELPRPTVQGWGEA